MPRLSMLALAVAFAAFSAGCMSQAPEPTTTSAGMPDTTATTLAMMPDTTSTTSSSSSTTTTVGGTVSVPPLDQAQPYTEVTAQQAKAIIDSIPGVAILDVRGVPFYEAGRIPGAVSMPEQELPGLESMDRNGTYLLYCGGNAQSMRVGQNMSSMGFTRVYRLVDGYQAWLRAGYTRDRG